MSSAARHPAGRASPFQPSAPLLRVAFRIACRPATVTAMDLAVRASEDWRGARACAQRRSERDVGNQSAASGHSCSRCTYGHGSAAFVDIGAVDEADLRRNRSHLDADVAACNDDRVGSRERIAIKTDKAAGRPGRLSA